MCYKQLENNKVRINVPSSLLGALRTVKLQRGGGRGCGGVGLAEPLLRGGVSRTHSLLWTLLKVPEARLEAQVGASWAVCCAHRVLLTNSHNLWFEACVICAHSKSCGEKVFRANRSKPCLCTFE